MHFDVDLRYDQGWSMIVMNNLRDLVCMQTSILKIKIINGLYLGFGKITEDDPPRTVLGGHIDIVV